MEYHFYPPALASGIQAALESGWNLKFLSTRSCERDLIVFRCRQRKAVFLSTRSCERDPSEKVERVREVFLSTRSCERDQCPDAKYYVVFYFYPPALASGIPAAVLVEDNNHFYPPALASGIFFFGFYFFLDNISIHPLLRAGSCR